MQFEPLDLSCKKKLSNESRLKVTDKRQISTGEVMLQFYLPGRETLSFWI